MELARLPDGVTDIGRAAAAYPVTVSQALEAHHARVRQHALQT
jgi:hypothetical protein